MESQRVSTRNATKKLLNIRNQQTQYQRLRVQIQNSAKKLTDIRKQQVQVIIEIKKLISQRQQISRQKAQHIENLQKEAKQLMDRKEKIMGEILLLQIKNRQLQQNINAAKQQEIRIIRNLHDQKYCQVQVLNEKILRRNEAKYAYYNQCDSNQNNFSQNLSYKMGQQMRLIQSRNKVKNTLNQLFSSIEKKKKDHYEKIFQQHITQLDQQIEESSKRILRLSQIVNERDSKLYQLKEKHSQTKSQLQNCQKQLELYRKKVQKISSIFQSNKQQLQQLRFQSQHKIQNYQDQKKKVKNLIKVINFVLRQFKVKETYSSKHLNFAQWYQETTNIFSLIQKNINNKKIVIDKETIDKIIVLLQQQNQQGCLQQEQQQVSNISPRQIGEIRKFISVKSILIGIVSSCFVDIFPEFSIKSFSLPNLSSNPPKEAKPYNHKIKKFLMQKSLQRDLKFDQKFAEEIASVQPSNLSIQMEKIRKIAQQHGKDPNDAFMLFRQANRV